MTMFKIDLISYERWDTPQGFQRLLFFFELYHMRCLINRRRGLVCYTLRALALAEALCWALGKDTSF